jgi:hypothetical protein
MDHRTKMKKMEMIILRLMEVVAMHLG